MKRLSEANKIDLAILPGTINAGANADSPFFDMAHYGEALVAVEVGAMADTATSTITIREATDAAGTNAQTLQVPVNGVDTDVETIINANVHVAAATLTVAAVQVGDQVTVNGVTFTGANAEDLPNNVFLADGVDNNATAASLADAINHATAGVPGVTAAANNAVVTLTATEPGEADITIADAAATITPATLRAVGFVDVHADQLTDGFTHLSVRVTSAVSNIPTSAVLIRGKSRYAPVTQRVAAGLTTVVD